MLDPSNTIEDITMALKLSTKFLAFSASVLLVASSVTSAGARMPANKRVAPSQSEVNYGSPDYDVRGRDSSCFSRATGLADPYACGSHGG